MSKLLVKPQAPDAEGRIHEVTPETAGWEHVGFAVHKLAAGQSLSRQTGDREHCLVLLSGKVCGQRRRSGFRRDRRADLALRARSLVALCPGGLRAGASPRRGRASSRSARRRARPERGRRA
jgi:hypothetical protein